MLSSLSLLSRRHTLRALMATAVAASASGCAKLIPQSVGEALLPNPLTDPAVFNFALNLEYLEAEYYLRGVYGRGVDRADIGPRPGPVIGGREVAFRTPYLREFMEEIANDEAKHVHFLRGGMGGSPLVEFSRPTIDLAGSFRGAGQAAGLGDGFDPFADEESFLIGAFLFEDVGVSAYHGAAKLLAQGPLLEAAAGILAIEGYHAGLIRSQIAETSERAVMAANAIAAARDRLDGALETEKPVVEGDRVNVANADRYGRAFRRRPEQVLNVAFLNPGRDVYAGGFFPHGIDGVVRHT
jgi:hypothetical protein